MTRKAIHKDTYRTLFAKTGNQCAFPECLHPLVDEENDFIAQICHIEAASFDGQRYNENMTDDQRRAAKNLIVLCYRHHVKTNNIKRYTVDVLKSMKEEHERKWSGRPFNLPDDIINQIIKEEINFRETIKKLNDDYLHQFDMARAIEIPTDPIININNINEKIKWPSDNINKFKNFFDDLPQGISHHLKIIGYDTKQYDNVKYYEHPFHNVFWETLNIGFENTFSKIQINLQILELLLSFQQLKDAPKNQEINDRLENLKLQLIEIAQTSSYTD